MGVADSPERPKGQQNEKYYSNGRYEGRKYLRYPGIFFTQRARATETSGPKTEPQVNTPYRYSVHHTRKEH